MFKIHGKNVIQTFCDCEFAGFYGKSNRVSARRQASKLNTYELEEWQLPNVSNTRLFFKQGGVSLIFIAQIIRVRKKTVL